MQHAYEAVDHDSYPGVMNHAWTPHIAILVMILPIKIAMIRNSLIAAGMDRSRMDF